MITVVNAHTYRGEGIYIGRQHRSRPASPLANPFKVGKDGERIECIMKYQLWLVEQLNKPEGEAFKEFHCLADIYRKRNQLTLICWCEPKPCHGNVINGMIRMAAFMPDEFQSLIKLAK